MIFTISGTPVHSEDELKVTISDLDKEDGTGRTEAGDAFRELIRRGVRQLDATWSDLEQSESQILLEALMSDKFFPVKYIDPWKGTITKTFYHGDVECLQVVGATADECKWTISTQFREQ